MTREEFGAGLAYLASAMNQRPSAEQAEAWYDLAGHLAGEQFLAAIKHVCRTRDARKDGFQVQINEIVRAAGDTGNVIDHTNRPMLAWSACLEAVRRKGRYHSVDFDDPLINAVVRDMGGWCNLCDTETSELQWVERRFKEKYQAIHSGGVSAEMCRHLPGEIELNNTRTGHNEHLPEVQAIKCGLPALPRGKVKGRLESPADRRRITNGAEAISHVAEALTAPSARSDSAT